jgi:rhamnose transport system permease protein
MQTREMSVAAAIAMLAVVLAVLAPPYFAPGNLRDVCVTTVPVLIIAIGMTLVILTGHIDISVGSMFAICGVTAGLLAKEGLPVPLAVVAAALVGALLGGINGALVAYARIPSIVVTLASLVAWRDGLRWLTQGTWVDALPAAFQWLGTGQRAYPFLLVAVVVVLSVVTAWTLAHVAVGRALYATGSNREAARLTGLDTAGLTCLVFVLLGALTGLAAVLNAARFNQIPANSGLGLELKVIAAVLVGGTAITGGRGTVVGTVLGVVLLGAIGPALTFLGVSAYWERAIQGGIILVAVGVDGLRAHAARLIMRPVAPARV